MRKGSIVIALIFMALGIAFIHQAQLLPESPTADDVGPGELPTWLGVAGVLLSMVLVVSQWRMREEAAEVISFTRQGAGFLLLALAFLVAIPFIGFVAAAAVFSAVGVYVLESSRKAVLPVAVGGGVAAFLYLVFQRLLDVPLPGGLLL